MASVADLIRLRRPAASAPRSVRNSARRQGPARVAPTRGPVLDSGPPARGRGSRRGGR
jgi:hypothetical protein